MEETAHVREGLSALNVHGKHLPEVLIDCSCGWADVIPHGADEVDRAEEAHGAHAERVRAGAVENVPTPAAQARIDEIYPEESSMTSKACNLSWYHTAHTWRDGNTAYSCPGVWPHPLPSSSFRVSLPGATAPEA